jgi:hypothetical protein
VSPFIIFTFKSKSDKVRVYKVTAGFDIGTLEIREIPKKRIKIYEKKVI